MAALILWTHALAALLFAGATLTAWRRVAPVPAGLPWRALAIALAATALWALAVAGIEAGDIAVRIAQAVRDVAWLGFMFALGRHGRRPGYQLVAVYGVVALVVVAGLMLSFAGEMVVDRDALAALQATRLLMRIMVALSALVLTVELAGAAGRSGDGPRLVVVAVAALWATDLVIASIAYAGGGWPAALIAARGVALVGIAPMLWIAADRGGDWGLAISRPATMQTLAAATLALYVGAVIALSRLIEASGGAYARLIEAALVIGATTTLLTLAANPWLRAWLRVKIAKHLFRHRYDYRAAWQRFSETIGQPGEAAQPLPLRVVRAMAELTDSPAGLLLAPAGATLAVEASWGWDGGRHDAGAALAAYCADTGRILELDAIRAGAGPAAGAAVVPGWMLDWPEAWALVPLSHGGQLAGAILLARPPVDRALDWEDYDLLRVAGRQAASCLAEDRAHAALAEAARFDEFNRRFAFIMHDIKNLVSQLSLVARNAERHADKVEFRADMVATLKESSERLHTLLARLSQHGGGAAEPAQPVDCAALARRVAARYGGRVELVAPGSPLAHAEPARLETVLGHLVQNAIDASRDGAPVRMAVAPPAPGGVAIDIADTGAGMSVAFIRDRLFRPFASTKPGGFGLGVFEARQAIEAMGGRIEVDSREGEGTCFRLFLPAARLMESAA